MTARQRVVSAAISATRSSGEPPVAETPLSASLARVSGLRTAPLNAAF